MNQTCLIFRMIGCMLLSNRSLPHALTAPQCLIRNLHMDDRASMCDTMYAKLKLFGCMHANGEKLCLWRDRLARVLWGLRNQPIIRIMKLHYSNSSNQDRCWLLLTTFFCPSGLMDLPQHI